MQQVGKPVSFTSVDALAKAGQSLQFLCLQNRADDGASAVLVPVFPPSIVWPFSLVLLLHAESSAGCAPSM